MPNELITSLRQDLSKIPSLIRRAEVAGTKLSKLETQYNNLKEDLAKIQKQKSVSVTDASTLEKTLVEAPKILWEQIRLAVKKNPEFDNPFFTKRLHDAAFNPSTFTLVQFKNGNIKVKLNLNETFGSLSDYGNAIKKVREELGTRSSADIASHFWSEKYYGAAREGKPAMVTRGRGKNRKQVDQSAKFTWKYWNTIRKRMSYAGKIAPFWEILDKGTMPIPNAHRKGGEGTAYPTNGATDFTGKTQIAIQKFYQSQTSKDKTVSKIDTTTLTKLMLEVKESIAFITGLIRELNQKALDPGIEVLTRFEKEERVSETKLAKLIDALRSKDFTNIRVTAAGRIEMTKPGGERYRPYISSMLEYYGMK